MELFLLAATIIWGIKPTAMKIGLRYISVSGYNVLRLIIATAAAWIAIAVGKNYKRVNKSDIKNILFVSLCGFFIFQWFYAIGISKTTAGNTSMIMGTLPLIVGVINHITGIEKISKEVLVGMLVSFGGLMLVIIGTGRMGLTPENIAGGFYLLVSASGYAIYTVFSKPLTKKYSANQITAYSITITTIVTLLFTNFNVGIYKVSIPLILSILYVGVIAMYLGNYIWMIGIKKVGSNRVALYNNLTPVFSVATAAVLIGEEFTFTQLIGGVIIFSGLYISKYRKFLLRRIQKE
jgi:drug/metabolite transporter (DMT)-like permease